MNNNTVGNPLNYSFVLRDHTVKLDTYKHHWIICQKTGNAYSLKKKPGMINRLLQAYKSRKKSSYSIYDYFTSPSHIQWSLEESQKVISEIFNHHKLEPKGKRILDVSGGNGHVANELKKLGAEVVLTEVNDVAIEYARDQLQVETYKFDFQADSLDKVVTGKFDIVLLRAAIMFCVDMERFLVNLEKLLKPGAVVVFQYCVIPTLGVLLRTQNDDYSYLALYQPETLIQFCDGHGLRLVTRDDEVDSDPYVVDHDANRRLTFLRTWYEIKGLQVLPFKSKYPFRARDRRRSNMIMVYDPTHSSNS
mgnify:CR=1 FL=1